MRLQILTIGLNLTKMENKILAARYIRVSSSTQNNARQLANQHPDEKVYIDVVSGAIPFDKREQGKELLFAVTMGTINQITVESIDRLGRDAFDIQLNLNRFNKSGVNVIVDNLGVQSMVNGKPNPIFKMITDVLANVAELTRNNIKESQAQGIKIAKDSGVYQQRATRGKISNKDFLASYKNVVKELNLGVNSLRKIALLCDVSLDTVQRVKKALKEDK